MLSTARVVGAGADQGMATAEMATAVPAADINVRADLPAGDINAQADLPAADIIVQADLPVADIIVQADLPVETTARAGHRETRAARRPTMPSGGFVGMGRS